MKILSLAITLLMFSSCQKRETVENQPDEIQLKTIEKMSPDQVMCAQDLCVTEEDLYKERGAPLYSEEEKLYYLKYDLAKSILMQRIVEKKLQAKGTKFIDYHRKLKEEIKITDEDVQKMLDQLNVKEVSKGSSEFMELKNKMMMDKIQDHYLKIFNEYKGKKDLFVKIPKKSRSIARLPLSLLVEFMKSSQDTLKVTLLINPSNRDQRNLLQLAAGVSAYFKRLDKKVGWYFLPVSTESEIDLNYNKIFICSVELDQGQTYQLLTEVTKTFKTEKEIFEYLEKRGKSISKINSCFQSKDTEKRIQELNVLARKPELNGARIIYNDEPESQVPGLIDLKNRVDQKLRIKKILAQ